MTEGKFLKLVPLALLSAAFSPSAYSVDASKVYLGAEGFAWVPDGSRDREIGAGARGLVGYTLSPKWSLEAQAFGAFAESDSAPRDDLDIGGGGIDGVYHFDRRGRIKPFALVGAGYALENAGDDDSDEAFANAGFGAAFDFSETVAARATARLMHVFTQDDSQDSSYDDAQIGLALLYRLIPPKPLPVAAAPAEPVEVVHIVDTDTDKVPDDRDQCPNTPAGVQVDRNGCELDEDNDGIPNSRDQCPRTPKGLRVDGTGCVREAQTLLLKDVSFEFNSDQLMAGSTQTLDGIAEGLGGQRELRFEVAGHTDSKGSDSYNLKLSQRRAAAVRAYLISKGMVPSVLFAKGYGESIPEATNETEEGRAVNRRVELKIINR